MAPYYRSDELVSEITKKITPHLSAEDLASVQGLLNELVQEAGRRNAATDRQEMERRFFAQAAEIQKIKDAHAAKAGQ